MQAHELSIPERYQVKEIDKALAQQISMANHYMHRKAPCSQAFGLYDRQSGSVIGILLFGVSASSTLLKGVCGPDEAGNVFELTRLWIQDGTPRNTESFFISQCIGLAEREVIVSYAEINAGHVGYVYQATNWFYTGLSTKFKDPKLHSRPGEHHTGWAHAKTVDGKRVPYSTEALKKLHGDDLYFEERPRKHRYVYINAKNKKRRKILLAKLRYKILPYPKKVNDLVIPDSSSPL